MNSEEFQGSSIFTYTILFAYLVHSPKLNHFHNLVVFSFSSYLHFLLYQKEEKVTKI